MEREREGIDGERERESNGERARERRARYCYVMSHVQVDL